MDRIREFEPARDGEALQTLWRDTLGHAWPLAAGDLAATMREGVVAERNGRLAGAAFANRGGEHASLQLVLVVAAERGHGLGARVHDALVGSLGVETVRLGGTPGRYLWPGLPDELAGARGFLERRGWRFGDPVWDLVRSLRDYETPAGLRAPGVELRRATAADRDTLLAFERRCFPHWAAYFEDPAGVEDAVLALDEGRIVATLHARDASRPQLWRALLGADCGEIGAVGVDDAVRGRGIGTALVAYASELLRDAGVGVCLIGWTPLRSFYGRLGYEPWHEYATAELRVGGRGAAG